MRGEKGEIFLRYNVNGIELDREAFARLQSELVLERPGVALPGEPQPVVLYVGRYADVAGTLHRMVVREGGVRVFDREKPNGGQPTDAKYYEVVAQEEVLRCILPRLPGPAKMATEERTSSPT